MYLTRKEEATLNGTHGKAQEIAMSILVKLGDMYGAEKLIDIDNVHIDAASYATIYEAGLDFCEQLSGFGGTFSVPTTLNTAAIDFKRWKELNLPEKLAEKQHKLAQAYMAMGGLPTWTCTPYQYGANVRFGQNVAWGESNAVAYVNSVIGARTNRFGDLVDVCAAIVGKVPNFGLYLDENRRGEILFQLEGVPCATFSCSDYALLGYLIGQIAGNQVPIVTDIPPNITSDQLKAFSAAVATSGSVALYHMCGVTPEAPTKTTCLQASSFAETVKVDGAKIDETKEKLRTIRGGSIDLVAVGCPHYSVSQLRKIARLMDGKQVKEGVTFWIFTSRMAKNVAENMEIIQAIERSGATVIADACPLYFPLDERGFHTLATDSAKMASYAQGLTELDVSFRSTKECVKSSTQSRR